MTNQYKSPIPMLSVLCSLFIILIGTYMLFLGFHNIDIGHNMSKMECVFNASLCDWSTDGICHTAAESVTMGTRMLVLSPFLLVAGAFLLGYNVYGYVEPK